VELPFKCNSEEFERIYQKEYKSKITHGFIRNELGLSESVRLKLNGTFGRWLYLLDENDRLYVVRYRIQTALWYNPVTGKKMNVSIFPNFIKHYCQPCLHLLEHWHAVYLCHDKLMEVFQMAELPVKREDAIAFFRFQIISEMLDAQPGFVEATAKKLSRQQLNNVANKRMVSFSERTIWKYYSNYKKTYLEKLSKMKEEYDE